MPSLRAVTPAVFCLALFGSGCLIAPDTCHQGDIQCNPVAAYLKFLGPAEFTECGPGTADPGIFGSTGTGGNHNWVEVQGESVYMSYRLSTDLYFSRSDDYGRTWSPSVAVDTGGASVGNFSALSVDGDTVYIGYYDSTNSFLKFAKSTDRGDTWPTVTAAQSSVTVDDLGPGFARNGDTIYMSYRNGSPSFDLDIARSTDRGETWSYVTVDTAAGMQYSSLAVDGQDVYAAYYDPNLQDLKFAKSTDGGSTWPSISTLDSTNNVGTFPVIALEGSDVYIVYRSGTDDTVKFLRSTDGGTTWGTPQVLITTNSPRNMRKLVVDDGRLFFSYRVDTNTINFAKSDDRGATWRFTQIQTNSGLYSTVARKDDCVFVAFRRPGNEPAVAVSVDHGEFFY